MRLAAALLGLLVALAVAAEAPPLPEKGPEGWAAEGAAKRYTGENLYDHIDGGAEIFLELGFARCEVRRYAKAGLELTVERYLMRDAAAASGIYLLQCGKERPEPSLGERHTVGSNQLLLVKGLFLLRLTGPPGRCPSRVVLLHFARDLSGAMPSDNGTDLFADLPTEGRVAGSERVVRGPVSLAALAAPFEGDALSLAGATAFAADYRAGAEVRTVLQTDYPDPGRAAKALAALSSNLEPGATVASSTPAGFTWKGDSGRAGHAVLEGSRLCITWGGEVPGER